MNPSIKESKNLNLEYARIIATTLKEFGEPIKLGELVELTEQRVAWRPRKNQSNQMKTFMRKVPAIAFSKEKGRYFYTDTVADENLSTDQGRAHQEKPVEETPSPVNQPVDPRTYKKGDTFVGHVSGIEDYGVFIESPDDSSVAGLIHRTNMVYGGLVTDASRHFKMGDKVCAKILNIKPGFRMNLSTKDVELPDYHEPKADSAALTPAPTKAEQVDTEYDEIFRYIQSVTGVVSPAAREKLVALIKQEGLFKFTVALTETKRDFQVDVGLLFASDLEKKLRGSL